MALGPGKYDDLCTTVRESAEADAALVIILNGRKGSGFSIQTADLRVLADLPALLRSTADQIEQSYGTV
jgi:hypothetical protein